MCQDYDLTMQIFALIGAITMLKAVIKAWKRLKSTQSGADKRSDRIPRMAIIQALYAPVVMRLKAGKYCSAIRVLFYEVLLEFPRLVWRIIFPPKWENKHD